MPEKFKKRLVYFAPAALNGLITLITIPVILHKFGNQAWADIALGQSIGAIVLPIVGYGWALSGATHVALFEEDAREQEFVQSIVTRTVILAALVPVMYLAVALLPFQVDKLGLLGAISIAAVGMNSVWYFVGIDQPVRLLVFDSLPRSLGTATGLLFVLNNAPVEVLLIAQIIGILVGTATSLITSCGRRLFRHWSTINLTSTAKSLRTHSAGMISSLVLAFTANSALPLISILNPSVVAHFAILDKTLKQVNTISAPLSNILTAGLTTKLRSHHDAIPKELAHESAKSITKFGAVYGILCAPIVWLLVYWTSNKQLSLEIELLVLSSLILGLLFCNRTLPMGPMAVLGKDSVSALALFVGLVLLPVACFLLVRSGGLITALGAQALAFFGTFVILCSYLYLHAIEKRH